MPTRSLCAAEVASLLGIASWPLKLEYKDEHHPPPTGEPDAIMWLYQDSSLRFKNEKGYESDRHARWTFSLEDCPFPPMFLQVENFHCTGTYGVEQGWAINMCFDARVVRTIWNTYVLRCDARGYFTNRVSMVASLPGYISWQPGEKPSQRRRTENH